MTRTTLLLGLTLAFTRSLAAAEAVVDIASRRELFVDHTLIERMDKVRLKLHEPMRQPLAKSPLPERHMITVIKDGDLFRAYWRDFDPSYTGERVTGDPSEIVRYAESRDGHEWTFPNLGLHEIAGSRENNVILAKQPPLLENFSPFLDARASVDPNERYKALAGYPGGGDKRGKNLVGKGLFAFVSPNGIHWTNRGEVLPYRPTWRHAF